MGRAHLPPVLWAAFRCLEFVREASILLSTEEHPGDVAQPCLRQGLQDVLRAAPLQQHKILPFWPRACTSTKP